MLKNTKAFGLGGKGIGKFGLAIYFSFSAKIMYVLIVYDIGIERGTKVHKLLKRYLHWRQNSVFEGEITEAKIEEVKNRLNKIIDDEKDSVLFYMARDEKWLKREKFGFEKNTTDNFL